MVCNFSLILVLLLRWGERKLVFATTSIFFFFVFQLNRYPEKQMSGKLWLMSVCNLAFILSACTYSMCRAAFWCSICSYWMCWRTVKCVINPAVKVGCVLILIRFLPKYELEWTEEVEDPFIVLCPPFLLHTYCTLSSPHNDSSDASV